LPTRLEKTVAFSKMCGLHPKCSFSAWVYCLA